MSITRPQPVGLRKSTSAVDGFSKTYAMGLKKIAGRACHYLVLTHWSKHTQNPKPQTQKPNPKPQPPKSKTQDERGVARARANGQSFLPLLHLLVNYFCFTCVGGVKPENTG